MSLYGIITMEASLQRKNPLMKRGLKMSKTRSNHDALIAWLDDGPLDTIARLLHELGYEPFDEADYDED